ncbi:multidrug efflux pump subunit AcrA (membrane-fusion protein) [Brevibacterium sanguinis]|uniref:Multidrug efflux pump subunit AcrA (Membrane-fusion protein) n=2 Tax=Brevibacterium TaxID=1696 RepID=A0A366IFG4_9MICO|nr:MULTISPECIES: HlyD family efflux transporter periplasmic adaptor subunit [Brevibacterium]RBP63440.1 multidrug efflux pump subunit AcrA (membrane-fusion protein) [Brevibacterium sanguinis]RBP69907.1 multidrug efflux pump subunit AcrA (membrane-fusion protein) [Brevibacterium celere]
MNVFRRVILPIAFLVVLVVIAALLAWIAFKPADSDSFDDLDATGTPGAAVIMAERGSIANTLELTGTIAVDAPTAVKAKHDGTVNHFFAEPGDEVLEGAKLFQVVSDSAAEAPAGADEADADAESGGVDPGAAPRPRYHTVVAPADGTVGDLRVELGDVVSADTEVTELLKRSFTAQAAIEPADLYRIPELPKTARITITDGPKPFDCEKLRLDQGHGSVSDTPADAPAEGEEPPAPAEGGGDSADGPQLTCTIPSEVTVYNNLALTMEVDAGSVEDAIVVPVTAVRGLTGSGTVWVIDETGASSEREIEVGLNDGSMVEVKKGLEEGEEIEEFVPGTEPEDAEMDAEGDMGVGYVEGGGF